MPGAFAHLTLGNQLTSGQHLGNADLPTPAKQAAFDHARFVDLGTVSPDYPYLAITKGDQKLWADNMHYNQVGDFIRRLLSGVRATQGSARETALAWLMGYIAHVVTDMTIHPVVELKVGPYEGNEDAHRICEMHQDVYIFQRMNMGRLGLVEFFDNGIKRCSHPADDDRIDPLIGEIWSAALSETFLATRQEIGAPDIDAWHEWFILGVDKIATEGSAFRLIPLARHLGEEAGLLYPPIEDIDSHAYINALQTPEGVMHYDTIFNRAMANVLDAWRIVALYVVDGNEDETALFTDWNLDTGRDGSGQYVYWNQE